MLRILIIIPITGLSQSAIDERMEYLKNIARPDTVIDYIQIESGPPAIESHVDHVKASAEVLKYIPTEEEYDAVIIWCGGDPGLKAARTLTDIPVVGPGEAMRLFASTVGRNVCGIVPDIPVLAMRKDIENTLTILEDIMNSKIAEGYDSFYLTCLALWGVGKTLRDRTGMGIIDGAEASLKLAEALADMGLKPSRVAYPSYPPEHRNP